MSFDDYANHIYQKHRLAVALAIIKSKPTNVNTEKYLEELKSKIDHEMDDDITICSDDFLMEDDDDDEMNDSVTILKNFDPEFVINEENRVDDNGTSEKPPTIARTNKNIPDNLAQIKYYDSSQKQATIDLIFPLTSDILPQDDQYLDIEKSIQKNTISKDVNDKISNSHHNSEIANRTAQERGAKEMNTEIRNSNDKTSTESMNVTYYDSQKTIAQTTHGFTENYTHFSSSQEDIVTPNKYLYAVNNNKTAISVQNKKNSEEIHINAVNTNDLHNETQFVSTGSNLNSKSDKNMTIREEFANTQTMNMFSQRNDNNFDEVRNILNTDIDETMTDLNIIINKDTESNTMQYLTQFTQNADEYFNEIQIIEENVLRNRFLPNNDINISKYNTAKIIEENDRRNSAPTENDTNKTKSYPEIANTEVTDETLRYNKNIEYLTHTQECNSNNNPAETTKDIQTNNNYNEFTNTESFTQNSEKEAQIAEKSSENDTNKDRREEYRIAEEDFDTEEIISYKVLEEFNKVKSFLSRQNRRMSCDGYSTDSGYRSDSQRSSNRSALQLSGNWLNQSGCCLFNYIMQCPLVAASRDITNEIAQVLSQLIDRLHEEEKYPSFLEDLLETIDLLLRLVYEGESSEDSEFLKKDEHIQRILLLSKSIHIQKHSIEKLTNILETFHSKVTETESTYELTNIDEIENITYIFHLLEILLKKYLKNREIFSQNSTQNSQEDEKVFKRSSITDIWRKKWNPSQKVFEGSREKKCVLKNCSEILNKIVVDCVSSYSLVAYSALKCFNCMQS